mgnify:FL=1
MSEIRANTISDSAGTGPIELTKQSAAKAWLRSEYSGGTPQIQNSLNISSLGDTGTGNQTVNFTNNMAGASEYAAAGAADNSGSGVTARVNYSNQSITASNFLAITYNIYSSDGFVDTGMHITVDGDLA